MMPITPTTLPPWVTHGDTAAGTVPHPNSSSERTEEAGLTGAGITVAHVEATVGLSSPSDVGEQVVVSGDAGTTTPPTTRLTSFIERRRDFTAWLSLCHEISSSTIPCTPVEIEQQWTILVNTFCLLFANGWLPGFDEHEIRAALMKQLVNANEMGRYGR